MNKNQYMVRRLRIELEATGSQFVRPHPADTLAYIFQELGEVSKEMLRLGYGASEKYAFYDHPHRVAMKVNGFDQLCVEFGDVMLMLCTLANQLGVDLSDALDISLAKILSRWGEEE